jgi:phosphatidylglycerophosphate synthase
VTAVRVALVGLIGTVFHATRALSALVAVVAYALDGLDGWYARRTRTASAFGGRFDMEADAFLVLVVELELWQRGNFGVWILSTGLLRYAYVLVTALFPPRRGELERSRYGRLAYGMLVIGLIAALIAPNALGGALAAFGTLLVASSFTRSFVRAYAPRCSPEGAVSARRSASP